MVFGLFNLTELHRTHGTLCFRNEVDVLNGSLIECDRPVRVILELVEKQFFQCR